MLPQLLLIPLLVSCWFLAGIYFFSSEKESRYKKWCLTYFTVISTIIIIGFIKFGLLGLNQKNWAFFNSLPKLIFNSSLLIIAVYDFYENNIPRFCSILLIPFFLLQALLESGHSTFLATTAATIGSFVFLKTINLFFRLIKKKNGLGQGDPEFVAMLTSFVGLQLISPIIVTASLLGICFSLFFKERLIPFGTMLSVSTFIILTIYDFIPTAIPSIF